MSLERLTTESHNPASARIDAMSSLDIVLLMNHEDAAIASAVKAVAAPIAEAIDRIAAAFRAGGRLIYVGAGTSGRLGVLDASECPPTFNSPPWQVVGVIAGGAAALTQAIEGAEDRPEMAVEDLTRLQLSKDDVLVGVAASGRTPYVLGAVRFMKSLGGTAIGLSCNPESDLAAECALMISPLVGPEVVSGSTRLKGGTATKMVLNMLTTGAMIRVGKTYGNLMVDLQSTNVKLADRSRRIVSAATQVPESRAAALLSEAHGEVKTAIFMEQAGVDRGTAQARLRMAGGRLREALSITSSEASPEARGGEKEAANRWLIGVDGGGSTTRAWLCSDHGDAVSAQPVGAGEAGASNVATVGWAAATANIERAIANSFRAAGREPFAVSSICLALAGAGRPLEQQRLEQWGRQRLAAEEIFVVPDAEAVLAAGAPEGEGIAIVAGTGSLAWGRRGDRTARSGGWGFLMGDEGSGYWIAREGLRACARMFDGRGPEISLGPRFLNALQVSDPPAFLQKVSERNHDRAWIAGLAGLVLAGAAEGDAVADDIVHRAAQDLAMQVAVVARSLSGRDPIAPFTLAVAGGILTGSGLIRARMLSALTLLGIGPRTVTIVEQPVAGAVRIAKRLRHAPQ